MSCVIIVLIFAALSGNQLVYSDSNQTSNDAVTNWACSSRLRPAVITEPGYTLRPLLTENGTYELDQHCYWELKAPAGSIVQLNFLLIELEWVFPCAYATLYVFDDDNGEPEHYIEHFCGNATTPPMYSSHEDMLIVFWAGDIGGNGRGFVANYSFIPMQDTACSADRPFEMNEWAYGGFTSPYWPSNYPSLATCSWMITSEASIRLEFIDFRLQSAHQSYGCIYDNITVYDVTYDTVVGTFCGDLLPDTLGAIGNSLLIEFTSDERYVYNGFRTRFVLQNTTAIACNDTRPAVIDWAPGVIVSPTTEVSNCHWRLTSPVTKMIKLRIQSFDLPDCYLCGCAGLDVYDGETHNSPEVGRYCRNGWEEEELIFGGDAAYLEYDSYLLAPHAGFRIEYEFYDTASHACGDEQPMEFSHGKGVVTSPNLGKTDYPPNSNCQWSIKSSLGYVIYLSVAHFELEHCHGCQCDYVTLYNGDHADSNIAMATWCGYDRPLSLVTSQQDAYVVFVSDSGIERDGFMINYQFEYLADRACQAVVLGSAEMSFEPGTIISPGYELGQNYPQYAHCEWVIGASKANKVIQLVILDLDIESAYYCDYDWLAIYDGRDEQAKLLDRYCGRNQTGTVTSTGGHMFLKFISNGFMERRGFHLEYTFEDPEPEEESRYLALILSLTLTFTLFVVLVAACKFSKRIKLFRSRLWNGRDASSGSETRGYIQPSPSYQPHEAAPAYEVAASIDRPPTQIDNQTYVAIGNYPPPTYAEAMGHTVRHENIHSHATRATDDQSESAPLQRQVLRYPLPRRHTQQPLDVNDRVNSFVPGNPDLGLGILMPSWTNSEQQSYASERRTSDLATRSPARGNERETSSRSSSQTHLYSSAADLDNIELTTYTNNNAITDTNTGNATTEISVAVNRTTKASQKRKRRTKPAAKMSDVQGCTSDDAKNDISHDVTSGQLNQAYDCDQPANTRPSSSATETCV